MQPADLEAIAARIARAASADEPLPVDAARLLVREYVRAPREEIAAALGTALARALEAAVAQHEEATRAAYLMLLAEASVVSDDARLADAARTLSDSLRAAWGGDQAARAAGIGGAAASIDACVRVARAFDMRDLVQPAIDELERLVAAVYRPGHGLLGGLLGAHVAFASTLLTCFDLTARLPYSMLAEELMQAVRRESDGTDAARDCAAVRVLCRLAALHDDPGYRAAAVLAPDADYRGDAARMLRMHAGLANAASLAAAARYGLALGDLMSLR